MTTSQPMVPLPLTCPSCWATRRTERLLEGLVCPECATVYGSVDGTPVLLADPSLRKAIADQSATDERTRFYQDEKGFLREAPVHGRWLEEMLAKAPERGVVLEVGSGSGAFAGFGGPDYCALDYSLSLLRTYLHEQRTICASAEAMPLATGSVRFLFSVATLEHVPRPDLALAEIDRVLAPSGVAYLAPAWHCRDWAADGLPVRAYRELTLTQKVRKALIPLRNSLAFRGAFQIPWRAWRRLRAAVRSKPTELAWTPLKANYEYFWMSDSDACASIDSHEGILFFESRGYEVLMPAGGVANRLLWRGEPVVVRKPLLAAVR